jgi:DNA-binding GntR family transcriptional regulator
MRQRSSRSSLTPLSSLVSRGGHAGPPVSTAAASLSAVRVVPQLREAIVEGRLEPGRRLSEVEIGELFGVSRTPARDAFAQLEREGLVVTVARAGAYVAAIDQRLVDEIYETREAIETQAARLAARRLGAVGEARLQERLLALTAALASADERTYTGELDRFYDVLLDLAANTTLRRSYEALSGPVRRLRRIAMRQPGRMAASLDHARAIVAAIALRDEDAAERAMRAQLTTARAAVTAVLSR